MWVSGWALAFNGLSWYVYRWKVVGVNQVSGGNQGTFPVAARMEMGLWVGEPAFGKKALSWKRAVAYD